jgi:hypothetical protein
MQDSIAYIFRKKYEQETVDSLYFLTKESAEAEQNEATFIEQTQKLRQGAAPYVD